MSDFNDATRWPGVKFETTRVLQETIWVDGVAERLS